MYQNLENNQLLQNEQINKIKDMFKRFLKGEGNTELAKQMIQQIEEIGKNDKSTFLIDLQLLREYNEELYRAVILDYYKLEMHLQKVVQEYLTSIINDKDRVYQLSFINFIEVTFLGDISTSLIGKLIQLTGTVTRTSEIRPELQLGTFRCLSCDEIIENIEQHFKFTKPKSCINKKCPNKTKFELDTKLSKFIDFQKIKVQENSNEIKEGSMPRSIEIILHNEIVDQAKPGDKCSFIGYLVAVPDIVSLLKVDERQQMQLDSNGNRIQQKNNNNEGVKGLKELGVRDLQYKLMFMANSVIQTNNKFNQVNIRDEHEYDDEVEIQQVIEKTFTKQQLEDIYRINQSQNLYKKLAECICPTVYGHLEIKKGLLLMLLGGLNKVTYDGLKLRGDLNLFIVGDPSTAKSQFLKYVNSLIPRSVYTSGKATSQAGLTASVLKDQESGELQIEAGALLLADNGVCCIDEFDKINQRDLVAIHEAMEQQTISLAKAGIQATLNARTSVLAAANPINGRYDKSKSLKANLDISAPIMSRFDLFYVVLDETNQEADYNLAQFILNYHMNQEFAIQQEINQKQFLDYIRFARLKIRPQFNRESAKELQSQYAKLRYNDKLSNKNSYRITIRQLESLIRLSEAIAKLHFNNIIEKAYVEEAARLLSNSVQKVERPNIELEDLFNKEENNPHILDNIDSGQNNLVQQVIQKYQEQKKQKQKTITITSEQKEIISNGIIQILRNEQLQKQFLQGDQDDSETPLSQDEIVEQYISQYELQELDTQEQLVERMKLIHAVIQYMINKDKSLIVIEDNKDYKQRKLILSAIAQDSQL